MIQIFSSYSNIPQEIRYDLEEANIFYTGAYENYIRSCGHKCIYAYDEGVMLVIVIRKKLIFKYAVLPSEPFSNREYDQKVFLNEVVGSLKRRLHWISQTNATANFVQYPDESIRIPFGNYIIDLTKDDTELFSGVTSKCRNMIRRAERDGVQIIRGGIELLDKYMSCDIKTWKRSDIDKDNRKVYMDYLQNMGENACIYIAEKEGEVQGGALFLKNRAMSYYLYGATADKPSPGAMNLLQWKAIVDFKYEGVKRHSFVGCRINVDKDSKYYGIQSFKKSFGGELVEGFMFKSILHPKIYKGFNLMYQIRYGGKRTGHDIIDQEIHKWKELNR